MNKYLLVIQPSEDVQEKMQTIKHDFAAQYECPQAAYLKPQIAVLQFEHHEMAETRFVHRIKNLLAAAAPYKIDIDGFDSFPSHTIFFKIKTTNALSELAKQLKPVQPFIRADASNKPHFITEPTITLANKLLPWQYEKAWLAYSHTPFSASFMVNELVLLRRSEGKKGYQAVAYYPLLGKRVQMQQACLF